MDNDVAVSVICNAFNHGKYIRDALNGFVMQKTDFKFEVLVHDDASKDDTADIIREFEAKYPDIIKPIYQTENQYSKNVWITDVYQLSRSKGKYIAICEGDDYWLDPCKLQKQYDALESHPEVDICVHASTLVNAEDGSVSGTVEHGSEVTVIPVEKVIEGGGDFVSTNSIFVRREILTDRSGMLYLPDNMSAYRVSVPGSWSVSNNKNRRGNLSFVKELMAGLKQLDIDTNKKYHGIISRKLWRLFLSKVHLRMLILFNR